MLDGTSIENTDDQIHGFDDFTSISLKIKRQPSGYSVKVKVKTDSSDLIDSSEIESNPDSGDLPTTGVSFKDLKKRMKSSFKSINKDLLARNIPKREDVESFVADTELMVQFPAKCGDPYPEFKMTCDRLLEAVDKSDLVSMRNFYAELKRLRDECHRKKS